MIEITKERLEEIIHASGLEPCDYEEVFDHITTGEIVKMASMLMASMGAQEPVYQYRIRNGYNGQVTEWQTIRRDQVDFVLKAQPHNAEFQIIAAPQPVPVVQQEPEWTNEQCLEFLSIAFRHAEIKGDLELDDIRLGVKMVNASRATMLQSLPTIKAATALDSSPKTREVLPTRNLAIPDSVTWEDVPAEITEDDMALASAWAHGFNQCRAMLQSFGNSEQLNHSVDAADKVEQSSNALQLPDGWIRCSERMPEKNSSVLICVNFDSHLIEPLICSARWTGSTFRRGEATVKPGNGVEEVTHWMPLPAAPQQEVK